MDAIKKAVMFFAAVLFGIALYMHIYTFTGRSPVEGCNFFYYLFICLAFLVVAVNITTKCYKMGQYDYFKVIYINRSDIFVKVHILLLLYAAFTFISVVMDTGDGHPSFLDGANVLYNDEALPGEIAMQEYNRQYASTWRLFSAFMLYACQSVILFLYLSRTNRLFDNNSDGG